MGLRPPFATALRLMRDPTSGYGVSFNAAAYTADRTITWPDASGTPGLLGTAQTWTASQTFGATVKASVSNSHDLGESGTTFRSGYFGTSVRVNNTYIDASNYERGFCRWNSNVYEIGTEAAGTGTQRVLNLIGSTINFNGGLASFNTNCSKLTMGTTVGTYISIGRNNTDGYDTTTVGIGNTTAGNYYGCAFGYNNSATGQASTCIGYNNTTTGHGSVCVGYQNIASATCSVIGASHYVVLDGSSAVGYKVFMDGNNGTKRAIGLKSAVDVGQGTTVQLYGCTTENPYPSSFPMSNIEASWVDATHASRKSRLALEVLSVATAQEALRIDAGSDQARIGIGGAVVSGQRTTVYAGVATDIPLVIREASSQTADVLQLTTSTGLLRHTWSNGVYQNYNTYTDSSNYERGVSRWNSNVYEIGAEAAGTGTKRVVNLLGDSFTWNTTWLALTAFGAWVDGLGLNTTSPTLTAGWNGFGTVNAIKVLANGTNGATTRAYLTAEGSTYAALNLVDSGASSGVKWFQMLCDGGIVYLTSIADNGSATTASIQNWNLTNGNTVFFGLAQFAGTSSSFPALKRSTTKLQARLADDSGYGTFQGKIEVHTAAVAETIVCDKTLRIFADGVEYKVPCVAA